MKILLTGGSGFLGTNLYTMLHHSNIIDRLGRTSSSEILCDLSQTIPSLTTNYQLVIHAAGKAHVREPSESEASSIWKTNVEGTTNLLRGLENCSTLPDAVVFISSVAVYGLEAGENISEEFTPTPQTVYAKSKWQAEREIASWCKHHNVKCGILRPPLIIGASPPGNLGRMIRSIRNRSYLSIRDNFARKSLVCVSDLVNIILPLSKVGGTYNVSSQHHATMREIEAEIAAALNRRIPVLPRTLVKLLANFGDLLGPIAPINGSSFRKLTSSLTFDSQKARDELGWEPSSSLKCLQNALNA